MGCSRWDKLAVGVVFLLLGMMGMKATQISQKTASLSPAQTKQRGRPSAVQVTPVAGTTALPPASTALKLPPVMPVATIPVVHVFVGKCKEIDVPLRQDVVYNDRVVLIASAKEPSCVRLADLSPRIELVDIRDYQQSMQELPSVAVHWTPELKEKGLTYNAWQMLCVQRWYVVRDWMLATKLERAFYHDSDMLLFANITEFAMQPEINSYLQKRTAIIDWLPPRACGCWSLWTIDALQDVCAFWNHIFKNPNPAWDKRRRWWSSNSPNDMIALGYYIHNELKGFRPCWGAYGELRKHCVLADNPSTNTTYKLGLYLTHKEEKAKNYGDIQLMARIKDSGAKSKFGFGSLVQPRVYGQFDNNPEHDPEIQFVRYNHTGLQKGKWGYRELNATDLETFSKVAGRYKRMWWVEGVPYMQRTDVGFIRLLGVHMMHTAGRCMTNFFMLGKWAGGKNATCACTTFCCETCEELSAAALVRLRTSMVTAAKVEAWRQRWHWPLP